MFLRDKRGMVLVWAAVWILAAMGVAAIVIDLGRLYVVREQVQTAVDAGSLAASLHGVRYVKVEVPDRVKTEGRKDVCCDTCCDTTCDDSGNCTKDCYDCNCDDCCVSNVTTNLGPVYIEGKRTHIWDKEEWYGKAECGSCGDCCRVECGEAKVVEQWIEYPSGTEQEARAVIEANLPPEIKPNQGGRVDKESVEIHAGVAEQQSAHATHHDPLAPSVISKVEGQIRSLLSNMLWGEKELPVGRCGQSGSFFLKMDEEGRDTGRFNQKPAPGCP